MIEKIVNELIKKEARQEAIQILNMANDGEINDFIYYHKNQNYNVCCLVIDTIKDRLIGENKIESDGHFGNLVKKLYDDGDEFDN